MAAEHRCTVIDIIWDRCVLFAGPYASYFLYLSLVLKSMMTHFQISAISEKQYLYKLLTILSFIFLFLLILLIYSFLDFIPF